MCPRCAGPFAYGSAAVTRIRAWDLSAMAATLANECRLTSDNDRALRPGRREPSRIQNRLPFVSDRSWHNPPGEALAATGFLVLRFELRRTALLRGLLAAPL